MDAEGKFFKPWGGHKQRLIWAKYYRVFAGGWHKTHASELINILKQKQADDILVICGGIIPQQDYQYLYDAGVAAIFGPGTAIPEAATKTLDAATDNLMRMHNYRNDRLSKVNS